MRETTILNFIYNVSQGFTSFVLAKYVGLLFILRVRIAFRVPYLWEKTNKNGYYYEMIKLYEKDRVL
jgi:hypothetical protein